MINNFIGLGDRVILKTMESLEDQFLQGKITLDVLRVEFSQFHQMATDENIKKVILMEFDGLEIGAKRRVT
jgi:hypothetical protein